MLKSSKKRKLQMARVKTQGAHGSLVYDPKARLKFITGFEKRKNERREKAQLELKLEERRERMAERRERLKEIKEKWNQLQTGIRENCKAVDLHVESKRLKMKEKGQDLELSTAETAETAETPETETEETGDGRCVPEVLEHIELFGDDEEEEEGEEEKEVGLYEPTIKNALKPKQFQLTFDSDDESSEDETDVVKVDSDNVPVKGGGGLSHITVTYNLDFNNMSLDSVSSVLPEAVTVQSSTRLPDDPAMFKQLKREFPDLSGPVKKELKERKRKKERRVGKKRAQEMALISKMKGPKKHRKK
eukprot:Platyproteum_vivax@DN2097_c0_g1_i1.p1